MRAQCTGVTRKKKTTVNHGRVIQTASQNKACLWDGTEAEGKSSRGRGTGEADNAWHRPKTACSPRVKTENGEHSLVSKASRAGLISVTSGQRPQPCGMIRSPADRVLECVVVISVHLSFPKSF